MYFQHWTGPVSQSLAVENTVVNRCLQLSLKDPMPFYFMML